MDTRESMQKRLVAKSEEDTDFRARLLANPKTVLKKLSTSKFLTISTWSSTRTMLARFIWCYRLRQS